jgi:hypothetical protein
MLDIETMGTSIESDDIIQIGLLEVIEDGDYYRAGKSYSRTLHTSQKPKNTWIEENHRDLLPVCRRTPMVSVAAVRTEILAFFAECGVTGPAELIGLNATTFDVPFMLRAGYLKTGDYHYGIYELKGAMKFAQKALKIDPKQLVARAHDAWPDIELPAGKKHEALYDCYSQLKTLNGLLWLARWKYAGV